MIISRRAVGPFRKVSFLLNYGVDNTKLRLEASCQKFWLLKKQSFSNFTSNQMWLMNLKIREIFK